MVRGGLCGSGFLAPPAEVRSHDSGLGVGRWDGSSCGDLGRWFLPRRSHPSHSPQSAHDEADDMSRRTYVLICIYSVLSYEPNKKCTDTELYQFRHGLAQFRAPAFLPSQARPMTHTTPLTSVPEPNWPPNSSLCYCCATRLCHQHNTFLLTTTLTPYTRHGR